MASPRVELKVRPRTVTGKKVRFLRRSGVTPANIYGHGVESLAVEVETIPLRQILRGSGATTLVHLQVEGTRQPHTVMIRNVQVNAITGLPLHVDFYQVRMTERMRAEVSLHFVGSSPAVDRGEGILVYNTRTIEVQALPGDLPGSLEVDLSRLEEVHSTLYVRDLEVSDKVTVLMGAAEPLVSVTAVREAAEDVAADVPAEPEQITREREEDGEEK